MKKIVMVAMFAFVAISFSEVALAVDATLQFEGDPSYNTMLMGSIKCVEGLNLKGKGDSTNKDVIGVLNMIMGGFCGATPKKGKTHTCSQPGGTGHFEFIFKKNKKVECSYNPEGKKK